MLYLILLIFLQIPILIGFGVFFQNAFGEIWKGISAKVVSGIFLLAVFWQILAFFVPISLYIEIFCSVFGLFLFFYYKQYKSLFYFVRGDLISILSFVLLTVFFASFAPFVPDYFGYYVPTIKWISEYGLVKGIVNLDWMLGQMSVWHVFQAGFSHFLDPFLRINVVIAVMFFFYILEKKQWFYLLFYPIFYFFIQSPSPDLPTFIISLIILNEILLGNKKDALLLGLSALVFCIKPTMIWLPMFSFFYSFLIRKQNIRFSYLGVFIIFLYVIKNVWTTGFPFFPVEAFNLGFSWSPNHQMFVDSGRVAAEKSFDMLYSQEQINSLSLNHL